jgi:hypothetical protein
VAVVAVAGEDEDEGEDDVEACVVGEQERKQGPVPVDGVGRQVVLLLAPGWKELWRPGNYSGSQPQIAERAARGVDWLFGEV